MIGLAHSAKSWLRWPIGAWGFVGSLKTRGSILPYLAVYLGQVFFAYWPVLKYPMTTLPSGRPTVAVVALFNAWTIWWNADRLEHGLTGYWDAPIFWPEKGCFALSEPQPLTLFVAPVVWLWGPIVAYHAYFLMNAWLNGLFALLLARRLGMNGWIAGVCGAGIVWLPLIYQQPELIQYVPLWPILWSWDICLRIIRRPVIMSMIELAAAIAVGFAANLHAGIFSLFLLGTGVLTLGVWKARKALLFVYSGAALGILGASPVVVPVATVLSRHAGCRPLEVVTVLSAKPGHWLCVPDRAWEAKLLGQSSADRAFNPGWFRVLLAGIAIGGIFVSRQSVETRQATLFVAIIACLAVCASLGTNFAIFGFSPWQCLHRSILPVSWVRSPYRFAYFGQLAILVLSALGLNFFAYGLSASQNSNAPTPKKRQAVLALLFGAITLVEVLPSQPSLVLSDFENPPDWVRFLDRNRDLNGPILILDFPSGRQVIEYDRTVQAMLWQSRLHLPLVNGYSGFFPERWLALSRMWRTSPYSLDAFELLWRDGVAILVRPPDFPPPPKRNLSPFRLQCLETTSSGVAIYRLTRDSD